MDRYFMHMTSITIGCMIYFGSVDAPPSEAKQAEKSDAKQAEHAM